MIRIAYFSFVSLLLCSVVTGCEEQHTTYSDAEYVMFADTVSVNMVGQDREYISVVVASTTACDYDRNFGVEVLDAASKAVEGLHYRLESNTVTIKAGTRTSELRIRPSYDALDDADTMNVALRLVMPDAVRWDLYGDRTNVKMVKSCPFSLDDFTGWCVVTSMFLNSYPGVENSSMQRLVRTEKHPTEPNMIIMRNWLFTGYDVTLRFHPDDPAEPLVSMDRGQVLSDEQSVFGQINGDDKILVASSANYLSYFNACQHFVALWTQMYVENLGETVGTVGNFYNIIEWVSDEEADRLQREEGM